MRVSQKIKRPGFITGWWIIGLVVLMSTHSIAGTRPNQEQPHNARKKEFIEQMKNGFLSFRLGNTEELLEALTLFRNEELEPAQDYAWTLSMYATQESDKVLTFVENDLQKAIDSPEQQGKALEFFEYCLDIAVWDLWQQHDKLDTKEQHQVMAVLNAVRDYRQTYPRKTEADLARDLKTMYPGELNSGIDYTAQAGQILSRLAPADSL